MARYPYDVNTTRRYIDVNKQFNGGLKTIDTDDSLGAVFLRQAENVSLSEFGFIEKRYGTYEKEKLSIGSTGEEIQGFWEYIEDDGTVNEIAVVGGKLYLREAGQTTFTEVSRFKKEGAFDYDESILGSAIGDTTYQQQFDFTYTQNSWYRPDTGAAASIPAIGVTRFARTQKLHLTNINDFNSLSKLLLTGAWPPAGTQYPAVSYILFWDESDTYMGYLGSPVVDEYRYYTSTGSLSATTDTIDLTQNKLGLIPRNNQEFVLPVGAAKIALVADNTTFTDEDGNTKYVFGQPNTIPFTDSNIGTGNPGFSFSRLGLLDTVGSRLHSLTTDYYPFQTTKEIQAAFVKDKLYIFTGTYPIYYKGGSTFYIFPIYRPSSVEVTNAGHNFLETRSFEKVYGHSGNKYHLESTDNFVDPSLDLEGLEENEGSDGFVITPRVSFTKQEFYPKLPFAVRGQIEGELNFELNYNYGEELGKTFDPYLYGQATQSESVNSSSDYTNNNFRLFLKDVSFAATNSTSSSEFTKIDPQSISNQSTFSNFTSDLNSNNIDFNQFRVRDDNGLFNTLVSETQLNAYPSASHNGYKDSNGDFALNPDGQKRNFVGKEKRHPAGISEMWSGINHRDLAISIEEEIVRTKESGNLAGQKFAIRFKRQTNGVASNTPAYEFFNFLDSDNDPNYSLDSVNFTNLYLSERFIVLIRPIIGNAIVENKDFHKLLYSNPGSCFFNNGILEFTMPDFPDTIDNQIVTAYSVHIKTVDRTTVNRISKRAKYLENYNGMAHHSLSFEGERLRVLWPGLGSGPTLLDYNLISLESPVKDEVSFGQPFKATISKLIPGTYDFKLTFALEQNEVQVLHPYEEDSYKNTWSSSTNYLLDDYVKYGTDSNGDPVYYKSLEANNHGHTPSSTSTKWDAVTFDDSLDAQDISTTTQYINIYFRNIEIFGEKITDYNKVQEDGKSPMLSCTKVIEHYGKLLVYGSDELPESVFVSFPDNFSYFPSLFRLEFFSPGKEEVQSITPFMDVLVTQTKSMSWGIRGNSPLVDSPEPYATFMITPAYGTIAPKSVQVVRNKLFFLSHLGVVSLHSLYAVDQQYNVKHEDTIINNIVPHDSEAIGVQFDNQYWLNFPNNGITLRWYANKNSWVQDKFKVWNAFGGVFKFQIVGDELEFITYKSVLDSGNPSIYRVGIDYTLPHDMRQPISSLFETSFLNQNYPFHPKNYKEAKLDFSLQNEYNKGRLPFYDSTVNGTCSIATHTTKTACEAAGGTWDNGLIIGSGGNSSGLSITIPNNIPFLKNHKYRVEFVDDEETVTHIPLTSVSIEGNAAYATTPVAVGTKTCSLNPETNTTEALCTAAGGTWAIQATMIYEFFITNDYVQDGQTIDFNVSQSSLVLTFLNAVTLRDVTYDDELTFDTYIISEDQTLNFDNYSGYTQATVDVGVDLTEKERLGDWKFGSSDFGKKVTAVKTIKLSGKGYNSKLYLEDTSSSKWTLESLGITYKMRRARSK